MAFDSYGRWFPDYTGQTMYNDPAYFTRTTQSTVPAQAPGQPMQMGPPTRRVDIIQIGAEAEANNYPVGAVLMTKDDGVIIIKTANGVTFYDKRPETPVPKPFDPDKYVTRDELEAMLANKGGAK